MDPGQWGAHWLIGCAWNADDADNAEDAEDAKDDDADDADDADDTEDAEDDDGADDKTSGHYTTGGESDNVDESLRGKRCKGHSLGQAR